MAIIALGVAALACSAHDDGDGTPLVNRYEPPPSLSRLHWEPVEGMDGSATDFLVRGDSLLLLDASTREVLVLMREPARAADRSFHWRRVSSFGRMGSGPGEFRRPAGMAWGAEGSVLVWDEAGRISRFATDGRLLDEMRLQLPCVLFRSSIASVADNLFLAGNCAGGGNGDTVYATAYRVGRDSSITEVARAPVFTLDMRFGSILTAPRLITESGGNAVFATGLDGCIVRLPLTHDQGGQDASRSCREPPARYRSPEPNDAGSMRLPNGTRIPWPDPVPPLLAHLSASAPHIVQLYSPDSLVVTPWRAGAQPVAVAPALEFVSCRDTHCLWLDPVRRRLALHSDSSFSRAAAVASR